jgi:hypothetical protein
MSAIVLDFAMSTAPPAIADASAAPLSDGTICTSNPAR